MWLPPAYRRPRSAIYWRVSAVVTLLAGLAITVAAVVRDDWFQFALAGIFGMISVWCWGALRAQHPRGVRRTPDPE